MFCSFEENLLNSISRPNFIMIEPETTKLGGWGGHTYIFLKYPILNRVKLKTFKITCNIPQEKIDFVCSFCPVNLIAIWE